MVTRDVIELSYSEAVYLHGYVSISKNRYIRASKILKDGEVDLYLRIFNLNIKEKYYLKIGIEPGSSNKGYKFRMVLHVEYKQNKRK